MDGPELGPEQRDRERSIGAKKAAASVQPDSGQRAVRLQGRRLVHRVERLKLFMRGLLLIELLSFFLLFLLVALSISLLFIVNFSPGPVLCWLVTLGSAGLALYFYIKWVFLRRRRHLSNLAMTAWIEKAIPGLRDRLITAVEFSEGLTLVTGGTVASLYETGMIADFFQETESRVRQSFLPRVLIRKRLLLALLLLAGWVWLFQNSHYFSVYTSQDLENIFLDSHRALWRNQGPTVTVEPGDMTLIRGEDAEIRAYQVGLKAQGEVDIYYRSEEQPWEFAPMGEVGPGESEFIFQKLAQPLEYFVTDGDTRTEIYRITLVERPELSSLRVKLNFPAYTGLGIWIGEQGQGAIEALADTEVELIVQFRNEVRNVELHLGAGEAGAESEPEKVLGMKPVAGSWTSRFTVEANGWYRVFAESLEGYSTGKELTYPIVMSEDQKPFVRIIEPEEDIDFLGTEKFPEINQGIKPKVPIRYECRDDFGVARVELHFEQEEGPSGRQILAEYGYGQREADNEYRWDVERFWGGAPVTYFLRAYDHLGERQEKRDGQTSHFSDSGRLHLFWGRDRDQSSPREKKEQSTLASGKEDSEADSGESASEEGRQGAGQDQSKALGELAERMNQLENRQQNLNRQMEQSGAGRSGNEQAESRQRSETAGRQGQLADEVRRLRRDLESTASTGEEEDSERLRQMARNLDPQKIEQTESGFQTRSGVEGRMRVNRQRLERGQWKEALEEGRRLEEELESMEEQLKQMAQQSGAAGAPGEEKQERQTAEGRDDSNERQSSSPRQGRGYSPGNEQPPSSGVDSAGTGNTGMWQVGAAMGSMPFDEYQPSRFDPPEMRQLGPKARNIKEFLKVDPEEDPFGNAPADERYPLKYEGLVEMYFESLVGSE